MTRRWGEVAAMNGGWAHQTVLVVEDDPWVRSYLGELLSEEGYTVENASNGQTGLRLAALRPPNAVLLDLVLPECSGLDVLDELKSRRDTRDIPVIVISAQATHMLGDDRHGAAAVLDKPFGSTE